MLCAISCYIGVRYNGTGLYIQQFMQFTALSFQMDSAAYLSLKSESCHDANSVVTGGTGPFQNKIWVMTKLAS